MTPNFELEKMKLEVEISQLEHNKRTQQLRIMQNKDENTRLEENMKATDVAITEIKKQLAELPS